MAVVLALLLVFLLPAMARPGDEHLCPVCRDPVEPGAAFCTHCGHKLESAVSSPVAATPAVEPGASVVRVVAAHDKEMTSAYGAIAFGSTVRVDSMIGSGFAVAEGEFVTDSGLLTGVREVFIYDAAQRKYPAHVIGVDHRVGIALLRAETEGIPPLAMRTGAPPGIGERLRAFGYPSGSGTAGGLLSTSGVLSGLRRTGFGIHPIEDYQQSDATLPSGFAGGPVIDDEGRLVGMSTAMPLGRVLIFGPVGIGLSVPVAWIERSLDWIRAGQPPRPWLGIVAVPADTERRKVYDLPPSVGAIVEEVFPGGPAERAGMRRGDGLLRVNGVEDASLTAIHKQLLEAREGSSWKVDIVRAGRQSAVTLTLAIQPENPRLSALGALRAYGGLEVTLRKKKLTVKQVLPKTLADVQGIEPGDVLQAVLIKKDLERAEKGSARWRTVRDVEKLEKYLDYAYSDLDFFVGLRFKPADGPKRRIYLHELLISTNAL
jgi:S1-C subfamily serine protease